MKYRQGIEFSFSIENPDETLAGLSVEVLLKIYDGKREILFENDKPIEQSLTLNGENVWLDELLCASLSKNGLIIIPTDKFFNVNYNIDWEVIRYNKMYYTNNYEFETQGLTPLQKKIRRLFPIAIPTPISESEFNKLVSTNWKSFNINDNKDNRAIGWLYKEIN